MKIENNRNIVSIARNSEKKNPVQATKTKSEQGTDQVDSKLSNALNGAVDGITSSGLTAGQVHSQVDEVKASGLLKSSSVDSSQPRLSDSDLLKKADQVAKDSKSSPSQAIAAFNNLDANRVAQLI
ncbi:MAG: hypothetical protein JWQ35_1737 [Bacteriovoracaceae bacterium]|nr:hypothetical protein [Bacteriovoracaceae bacterium]